MSEAQDELIARLEDLHQRLQLVEDRQAILALLNEYSQCMDYRLVDRFVQLFTPDGRRIVLAPDGTEMIAIQGTDELADHLINHPQIPNMRHLPFNPVVEVQDATHATASTYSTLVGDFEGAPTVLSMGRYFDILVKREGTWLLAERKSELMYRHQG